MKHIQTLCVLLVLQVITFGAYAAESYSKTCTFTTSGQSMWSPGHSGYSYSKFLGASWGPSSDTLGGEACAPTVCVDPCFGIDGGCEVCTPGLCSGGTVSYSTNGQVGVTFTASADVGAVAVNYPVTTTLSFAAQDTVHPGSPLTISASCEPGAGSLTTSHPSVEVKLVADFVVNIDVSATAHLLGATVLDIHPIDIHIDEHPTLLDLSEADIGTLVDDFGNFDIIPNILSGQFNIPMIDTFGTSPPKVIASSGQDDLFDLSFSITNAVAALVDIPPLSGSFGCCGLSASYSLLQLVATLDIDAAQAFSFDPNVKVTLNPSIGGTYTCHDGGSTSLTMPNLDSFTISPTFDVADNSFTNDTSLVFSVPITFDLLTISVSIDIDIYSNSFTIQPFPTITVVDVPLGSISVFSTDFSLEGFSPCSGSDFTVFPAQAPVISCPTVSNVSVDGICKAFVPNILPISATDNYTPSGNLIQTQSPPAGTYLGLGTHSISVHVCDLAGNCSDCSTSVTFVDTTPPYLSQNPPAIGPIEQTNHNGTPVPVPLPVAHDNCDPNPIVTSDAPATFPLGKTLVTFTLTDIHGNVAFYYTTVTVVDTTPPNFISLTATPNSFWPCNHKLNPVVLTPVVSDICDLSPDFKIVSVTSNEPINGTGDGNTDSDWQITGDLKLNLRAERAGNGDGRIYTVKVRCTDDSGNSSFKTVTVTVPKSQGK